MHACMSVCVCMCVRVCAHACLSFEVLALWKGVLEVLYSQTMISGLVDVFVGSDDEGPSSKVAFETISIQASFVEVSLC